MPKHDPPGDDAALLELERELMELDRAIRAAEENREASRKKPLPAGIGNQPPPRAKTFVTDRRGRLRLIGACGVLGRQLRGRGRPLRGYHHR